VPGCYPTSVTLALAPALAAGLVEPDVVVVAATGTSGAGKSAKPHLIGSEVMGSVSAYGVGGVHRHTPEMVQNLAQAAGGPVGVSFTPMLVPMSRGILATCSAPLTAGTDVGSVRAAYEKAYADEPFVHLLPEGQWPTTAQVLGANTVALQVAVDADAGRLVVIAAVDNLTKGTGRGGGAVRQPGPGPAGDHRPAARGSGTVTSRGFTVGNSCAANAGDERQRGGRVSTNRTKGFRAGRGRFRAEVHRRSGRRAGRQRRTDDAAPPSSHQPLPAARCSRPPGMLAAGGPRAVVLTRRRERLTGPGPRDTSPPPSTSPGLARHRLRPDVAVASTGLIGVRLPMDKLTAGVTAAAAALSADGGDDAALAIMTTDSVPKRTVQQRDGWTVGGMAKGAGMLAPSLATMLVVLTTDAVVPATSCRRASSRRPASASSGSTPTAACPPTTR
jgi:hypothetical protein